MQCWERSLLKWFQIKIKITQDEKWFEIKYIEYTTLWHHPTNAISNSKRSDSCTTNNNNKKMEIDWPSQKDGSLHRISLNTTVWRLSVTGNDEAEQFMQCAFRKSVWWWHMTSWREMNHESSRISSIPFCIRVSPKLVLYPHHSHQPSWISNHPQTSSL